MFQTENVLFDATNRVKLADFGFANFYADNSMLSTWCGYVLFRVTMDVVTKKMNLF